MFLLVASAVTLPTRHARAPIDVVRELNREFCAAYNAGRVSDAAAFYNPGADIVPPDAASFVKGSNASPLLAAQLASGATGLNFDTLTVAPDNDNLYHEVGNATHALNPGGRLYYVRWALAGGTWHIATSVMAISGGWRVGGAPTPAASNATAVVRSMDLRWAARYNAGDFAGVADLYSSQGSQEWARLVAPAAHDFLQPNEAFFRSMHDPREGGVLAVQLRPALCVQASASVIHEIGRMDTASSASRNDSHSYYARWEQPAGRGSWVTALMIMSIGGQVNS
jgi:ketosteroid isomerase-like protein